MCSVFVGVCCCFPQLGSRTLGGGSVVREHNVMPVFLCDMASRAWTMPLSAGSRLPSCRGGHTATYWNGWIFVFGGVSDSHLTTFSHFLDSGIRLVVCFARRSGKSAFV